MNLCSRSHVHGDDLVRAIAVSVDMSGPVPWKPNAPHSLKEETQNTLMEPYSHIEVRILKPACIPLTAGILGSLGSRLV